MALSDAEILLELKRGDVVIEPFHPTQLANSSYDVTLGEHYYRQASGDVTRPYCPWNAEHQVAFWDTKPSQAHPVETEAEAKHYGARIGDRIIIVAPRETILAHTQEFIGGRRHITTKMQARSSLGRS